MPGRSYRPGRRARPPGYSVSLALGGDNGPRGLFWPARAGVSPSVNGLAIPSASLRPTAVPIRAYHKKRNPLLNAGGSAL
jgi:hypothetical protein